MLAVTMIVFPGESLIHAVIITGMLVGFPHLTALRWILLHSVRAVP